jgi:TonB family protein
MRLPRPALALLALTLAGPALLSAQEQPLAAGSEGVPLPKKKKHVQPVYPPEALAQGIRGIVILDLVIDTEGRVTETKIIRSIPGLDEAALAAVQQWVYEPVEVDGKPVSVRLTVPITFALKLPEMTRQDGIPELRQGVRPQWPREGKGRGLAVADVTLEPDGRIALARIIEGEEPWSTSLLRAVRTWRFRAAPDDVTVSFRVEAEFLPGGPDRGDVKLRLSGLREARHFDVPQEETAALTEAEPEAATEPSPEALPDSGPPPSADEQARRETAETAPAPSPGVAAGPVAGEASAPGPGTQEPAPGTPPEAPETPEVADASTNAPEAAPAAPEATPAAAAAPPSIAEAPPAVEETPPGAAEAPPAPLPTPASPPPAPKAPGEPQRPGPVGAQVSEVDPTAAPPIEVLTASLPPLPPENGISAIRGVELEPGVPDLARGRRPVAPPFARMAGANGVVTVEFSVSAGGITTVQRAEGPDVFLPAATQAVESWIFRRTRPDRAYLIAVFTYEDDLASAVVRPQPAP